MWMTNLFLAGFHFANLLIWIWEAGTLEDYWSSQIYELFFFELNVFPTFSTVWTSSRKYDGKNEFGELIAHSGNCTKYIDKKGKSKNS